MSSKVTNGSVDVLEIALGPTQATEVTCPVTWSALDN